VTPSGVCYILLEEIIMAWKTPKIAEVAVGMEINMYACAKQK
jgi:coenzyme PQQ precursor peptide PqqA